MMTFHEREQAFEAKFAHDEEFRFLVTARRDRLFAQWAADRLQLAGQARAALTTSVLAVRDGVGHDERLRRHVEQAFTDGGVDVHGAELASALNQCAAEAQRQLLDGIPQAPALQ